VSTAFFFNRTINLIHPILIQLIEFFTF